MNVSIILVSFNTKELTRDCLKSVFEKTMGIEFEVFVVDNASTDGSVEMIEQEFPQVKVIKNPKNKGFGAANNIAIRQSNAKYVFLLNTDTILLNNAVKIFFDFMEKPENDQVGCCGGNLYRKDLSYQHSYGNISSLENIFIGELHLYKVFKKYCEDKFIHEDKFATDTVKVVEYVTGADMFLRKSVLNKVGLFDERFFMYCEDSELCYRIKKYGYKSVIVPESKIIHLNSLDGRVSVEKLKLQKISELKFFRKYYGKKQVFIAKLSYIFCYFIKYIYTLDFYFLQKLAATLEC